MFSPEIEDLKLQIIGCKKQNIKLHQENVALKIRLRKSEDTIAHRNKIIDSLLNSKQPLIGRNLCEFGASLLIKLKEENEKLKLKITDQQIIMRRLKQEVMSSKLYLSSYTKTWSVPVKSARSSSSKCNSAMEKKEDILLQRSISEDRGKTKIDLEIPGITIKVENDELPEIVKNKDESPEYSEVESETDEEESEIKSENEEEKQLADKKSSEKQVMIQEENPDQTETKIFESKDDKPHEEIQLLQNSFKDMINEVKELKESIFSIQKEQVKTSSVLQQKDSNLEKLATEIKNLSKSHFTSTQKMETKNNRDSIGGKYGLTPKKKCDKQDARCQYKVISSPKYNGKTIHVAGNNRRIMCNEIELDKHIDNILSDF